MRRGPVSWLIFGIGTAAALLFGLMRDRPIVNGDESASELKVPASVTAEPFFEDLGAGLVRREVALLGSSFVFVVEAPRALAHKAIQVAVERVEALEGALSSWRPSSEVYRLNTRAGIEAVEVGDDTLAVLSRAMELHQLTDGAFDVTIGPIWDLWPFREPQRALPSKTEIDAARKLVDSSLIELDKEKGTAFLPRKGMKVNLGAIGKGYAAELAIETLKSLGIRRAAVGAGGDLYLLGRKSSGPWVVGIDDPAWPGRFVERFVAGDIAVATSGSSERYVIRSGKRYGHILDPLTGYPAAGIQSVTVITKDATVADAYATAVFVKGEVDGLRWVEGQKGVEVLIVNGAGEKVRSSGWRRMAGDLLSPSQNVVSRSVKPASGGVLEQAAEVARTTPTSPAVASRSIEATSGEMVIVPAPGFEIDRSEVSNAAYARFLQALTEDSHRFCHPDEPKGKDHRPRYWREFRPPLFLNSAAVHLAPFDASTFRDPAHPVVGVDWWDAYAFARWAGKRLPRRDEWQRAARGVDDRVWPWGDSWDPAKTNSGGERSGERDGYTYTAPADSFLAGASAAGCLHMAGNVAEWTEDGFIAGGSFSSNPSGVSCTAGEQRKPGFRSFDLGFRCVAGGKR